MSLDGNYCVNCGQEIKQGLIPGIIGGTKHYKFKDGVYCETCARLKVEKQRGKIR